MTTSAWARIDAGLTYHTRFVSEAAARVIFERAFPTSDRARLEAEGGAGWLSAIGHDATAQVATSILGYHIPVSRIAAAMAAGDEAIAIKLRGRAPEGVVLTRSEMARGTASPAAEIAGRWHDPHGWEQGAPPADLEFTVPRMEERLNQEIDLKVKAQGSDPAGMLRVSMLTVLRRIVHEHLDSAVADTRSNGKVTDDDLRRMRASLTAHLLDQIGELGEEVDCGRGEQD